MQKYSVNLLVRDSVTFLLQYIDLQKDKWIVSENEAT